MTTPRTVIVCVSVLLVPACSGDPGTTPSTTTSPGTQTFASALSGGRAWRLITASADGFVNLTLTSVGPPSIPIGLGLGVPGVGSTCALSVSLIAQSAAVPQISERVDQGDYCAEVFDLRGPNASLANFSVTIEHP